MMKKNVALMRYQTDKLANRFCIFSIVFDVIYFLFLYSNNRAIPDMNMGADVLVNIVFMLFAFLASEKVKAYDRNWSFVCIGIGIVQILRIFWLPAHYLANGGLTSGQHIALVAMLLLSAASMILAGVVCYTNSTALMRHLASEKEVQNG